MRSADADRPSVSLGECLGLGVSMGLGVGRNKGFVRLL